MSVIETKGLTKSYGKSRGIVDVNLSVESGEVFGFIGPNGAGKSTTIRTLLGLIRPTGGTATIFGKSCWHHPEVRRDLGYLPSEVFYYDKMRVIDLLNYSASFYKKDCTERIHELAGILDLDLKRKINRLSYGNRKKVGIVQGLLHDPKLVILDEPTGGLDPLIQQNFFQLIRREKERGVTVFFSSHILSEVQKLCDRVAFIKEGRIIRIEKISTLQENNYKRINLAAKNAIDKETFHIEGISALMVKNNQASFMFKGDLNPLIQRIASLDLLNLSINEPDLEEIFLHYYEKGR